MSQIPANQGAIKASEIAADAPISAIGSQQNTDMFSVINQIQQLAMDSFFRSSISPFSLGQLFWDGTQLFFNQNGRGNNLMIRLLQTQDVTLRTIDLILTGSATGNTATTIMNLPLNNNDLAYIEIDRATLLAAPGGVLTLQNNASGGSLVSGKTLKIVNLSSTTGLPQIKALLDGTGSSLFIPLCYRYDWTDGVTNFQDLNWAINRERWAENTISFLGTPISGGVEPTGTGLDFWGPSAPDGYVMASGRTIGNAGSNSTERANSDTSALFAIFWNNYSDAILPMYTSTGFVQPRGVSAAADFAANMQISLPDLRGRVTVKKDDMGGSAAGRVTGFDATILGNSGGEESHVLSVAELAAHSHLDNGHNHSQAQHQHSYLDSLNRPTGLKTGNPPPPGGQPAYSGDNVGTTNAISVQTAASGATINFASANIANTGSNAAHNNLQPGIVCNYILKL